MKQTYKRNVKKEKGITLIALVVTIIVLLILAAVSIATLTGENGILTQANKAKEETMIAERDEKGKLDQLSKIIDTKTLKPTSVFAKLYDVNKDGIGETLVLSSVSDYDNSEYGNLITDYGDNSTKQNTLNFSTPIWYNYISIKNIEKVIIKDSIVPPNSMSAWFMDFEKLTTIENITNINTSLVKNMDEIFENCISLESIDVSSFNMNNIQECFYMFSDCENLKNITIGNFTFSNNADMSGMFARTAITNLKFLSEMKIPENADISEMFDGCSNLTDISEIANWNILNSNGNLQWMFYDCSSLNNIEALRNWNVSNIKYMNSMFTGCTNLKDASPINDWDISNVTTFEWMFKDVPTHPEFTKKAGTWDSGTFTPLD